MIQVSQLSVAGWLEADECVASDSTWRCHAFTLALDLDPLSALLPTDLVHTLLGTSAIEALVPLLMVSNAGRNLTDEKTVLYIWSSFAQHRAMNLKLQVQKFEQTIKN